MHRQAWIYTMTATVLGAFGVLLRWLQCQTIFEPETGLAAREAPISFFMAALLIAVTGVLWLLSRRLDPDRAPTEPEDALALPHREVSWVLTFSAALAAAGAAGLFFAENSTLLRLTALLALLSAPVLVMLPALPRWGGFGAVMSVLPVVFFCLWLVAFYKTNAVNPTRWAYAVQLLAIAACLHGVFRLCGYVFYRIRPRRTVFACGLALAFSLTVLMDDTSLAARLLFAGWGIGLGTMCWVLLQNFLPPGQSARQESEEAPYPETGPYPLSAIREEGLVRRQEEGDPHGDIIP